MTRGTQAGSMPTASQDTRRAEALGYGYEGRLRGLIQPAKAGFVDVARPFMGRAGSLMLHAYVRSFARRNYPDSEEIRGDWRLHDAATMGIGRIIAVDALQNLTSLVVSL
jgi:hypothetical protein